ncbi:outer membrane lipoprotein-sorting protein [Limnochorda pilosa]|uniref:Uncharacterized protein TP-0789 domain-containing protein n=1 Tax=Limnochorda pilosa TaxID=1555112 RepID=A0A0K2SJW1_LIMPI|nr:outer membrane lipoprotein-sorting protein [Limnochorda pilosa]BAS27297.1 hypothetical protein LIP_1448 [Limnochorda pilosa]
MRRGWSGLAALAVFLVLAMATAAALLPTEGLAQTMSAREIVERSENRPEPRDLAATQTIRLISQAGGERSMQMQTFRRGDERMILWFVAPGEVRGTSLLRVEREDGEADIWLYLPAMRRTRRVSGSAQSGSFMGTDFSYNDMGRRRLDDYEYTLVDEAELDGEAVWVIEMVPRAGVESDYSRIRRYIRMSDFVTLQEDLYDGATLWKVMTVGDIHQIGGYTLPGRLEMVDVVKNHRTVMTFDEMAVDQGIDESFFSPRSLERIP